MTTSREDLLLIIIAILLPPLAVFLEEGLDLQFVISLVLTVIGVWILGVVHAVWIVLR
jgi:uncharacterized membrane protein YqaE (UPF0057 family)